MALNAKPGSKVRTSTLSGNTLLNKKAGIRVVYKFCETAALVLRLSKGPTLVWCNYNQTAVPGVHDLGWITTTESVLGSYYNDCEQYQVTGRMTYDIGLTNPLTLGRNAYDYPVDISKNGDTKIVIMSNETTKVEWNIHVASSNDPETKLVKVDSVTYRLKDGIWVTRGYSNGAWTNRRKPRLTDFYLVSSRDSTIVDDWVKTFLRQYSYSKYEIERAIRQSNVKDFGTLAKRAANSIRSVDVNGIAFIRDFIHISDLARSMNLSGALDESKKFLSKLSGFYLANHYGTRLTGIDTWKIVKAYAHLNEFGSQSLFAQDEAVYTDSSTTVDYLVTRRLTGHVSNVTDDILHATNSVGQAIDQLKNRILRIGYETDLLPTFENIWDLIPYSFVSDWFVPIGDALAHREATSYMQTLPIEDVFLTTKVEWDNDLEEYTEHGFVHTEIRQKYYWRICTRELPLPRMQVDTPKGFSPKHWLESSAIILQAGTRA